MTRSTNSTILYCPECRHPIDFSTRRISEPSELIAGFTNIECPNCGQVQISCDGQDTLTHVVGQQQLQGAKVAHFSLVRLLGRGSFGEVWLADDVILGRQVALKLPRSPTGETANLLHEAKTAANLNHPHIVSVYEVGSDGEQVYIASQFIDGLTLRDYLSAGTPTTDKIVEFMITIAEALQHAHEHGVVHRDVKPSNIIVDTQGRPHVTDFGVAKRISAHESISSEGAIVGTVLYMSPEQADGKIRETDHRSDIYALGVVLFESLTGHTPFRGNVRALLHQKTHEDAPSPRALCPKLPRDLETICLKCLERSPGKRYQSAAELNRFRVGDPIKARPISAPERAWRWSQRHSTIAGLLLALFLSLSGGLIGVSYFYHQAWRNAQLARQSLYRAQMNLAAEYLTDGDIEGVRTTLDRIAADDATADLRGFEWRYFQQATAPIVQLINYPIAVNDVAVSGDGDIMAACGDDHAIRLWDAKTGKLLQTLSLEVGQFRSIAFSPAGSQLAAGASDGSWRIWDPLKSDKPIQQKKHGPPVALVRYAPDGRKLLTVGASGAARIWDLANSEMVTEIPTGVERCGFGMSTQANRNGLNRTLRCCRSVLRFPWRKTD